MNKRIIDEIQKMRSHFGWDKTDTKEFMVNALVDEAVELKESLSESETAFKNELADVLTYAFAICIDEGYDIESIIITKIEEVMSREY